MDTVNSDDAAISGQAQGATYDDLTGGTYAINQDPFTAAGDGTVNNATAGAGTAAATAAPAGAGSSYNPASWFTAITGVLSQGATDYTTVSNIVGGKPAVSPKQAGAPSTAATVPASIAGFPVKWLLIGLGIVAAIFFLPKLLKRKG